LKDEGFFRVISEQSSDRVVQMTGSIDMLSDPRVSACIGTGGWLLACALGIRQLVIEGARDE